MTVAASSFSRLLRRKSCSTFCLCAAVAVWLHSVPAKRPVGKRCVVGQPCAATWQGGRACVAERDIRTRASSKWAGKSSSRDGYGVCVLKSPIRHWSLRAAKACRSSSQAGSWPRTTISWHCSTKEKKKHGWTERHKWNNSRYSLSATASLLPFIRFTPPCFILSYNGFMAVLRKNVLMKPVLAALCPLCTTASALSHALYTVFYCNHNP